MKSFSRSDRIEGQIQKVLSDLLIKNIKDPRLELTTITGVKMTQDLRLARIYFVTSNQNVSKEDTISGFKSALGFIKRTLAKDLKLKYMPDLKFYHDDSFDYGSRIDTILRNIESNHAANHTSPDKQ